MSVFRAISAEWLKTKRTLALWLAPIAPLVIVALQMAIIIDGRSYYRQHPQADAWSPYATQTLFLWGALMLPLFITLETALLANLEHGNQQWKHLFALPMPRGAIYAAKVLLALLLIGLSTVVLYGLTVLSGLVLRLLFPGLGFEAPIPWLPLLRWSGLLYLSSWLIIALHTWVALRWRSFVVASAVGIGAVVVAVVILQSDWGPWYPWTLPAILVSEVGDGLPLGAARLVLGSLGGLAVALLGGWEMTRRDVA